MARRREHLCPGDRRCAAAAWRPGHLFASRARPLDPRSRDCTDSRSVFRQLPRNALARLRVAFRGRVRAGFCRRGLDGHGGSRIRSRRNSLRLLTRFLLRELRPTAALFGVLVALPLTAPHILARPHILALPLLVAWIAALIRSVDTRAAPSWFLLPLMTLWANLHGSFTFGLAMI